MDGKSEIFGVNDCECGAYIWVCSGLVSRSASCAPRSMAAFRPLWCTAQLRVVVVVLLLRQALSRSLQILHALLQVLLSSGGPVNVWVRAVRGCLRQATMWCVSFCGCWV